MKKLKTFSILLSLAALLSFPNEGFSQDLSKGLVAYWPFCGCTAKDATGNGHDGTLTNGPTCVAGKFDQAYQFDGTNGIDVPFSSAFDIPQDSALTLAAWVKLGRTGGYQALVIKGTDVWDYGLYVDVSGSFMFGSQWPNHETFSKTIPAVGQWYHVVGVYRNKDWKLFVNGKLEDEITNGTAIGRSSNGIGMAKKGNTFNDPFTGTLDEVRFYNRALSDSEVAELYRLSPIGVCGITPKLSYLIPDIGAPAMNTYVEIIAPYDANGSFGSDTLYANNPGDPVRVVCANPSDSTKFVIGPVVVSWDGRVISTQVFVKTCSAPNSSDWRSLDSEFKIPLKVIANGVSSNTDTFFIVKPLPVLTASGGGVFGSGGQWGVRSKRGALIFDSISLGAGTYTVSTTDCDPYAIGNQGFLPVTILSKGPVSLSPGATLSVSSTGYDGGPGGGGGSMGDGPPGDSAGNGFVGGAPGEDGPCPATGGVGSGGLGNGNTGGVGMNGIPTEASNVPQCEYYGGTGNPFVSEGGGVLGPNKHEGDGNGGGFGTAGQNGYGSRGYAEDIGGVVNGNTMLVPLMGGSGGGGGNEFCACASVPPGARAGGGGGSILLSAPLLSLSGVVVTSNGASGVTGGVGCSGHGSVGGCGSGGGVILATKLSSAFPSASAAGGISLHTHADNGSGGAGRIRFDGPISNTISISPAAATYYRGVSTDTTSTGSGTVMLTGTGSGDSIRIYSKTGSGPWLQVAEVRNYTNNQWSQSIPIVPNKVTYLVAMQQVFNPSTATATMEPSWVMSQAAANILNAASTGTSSLPEMASTPIPPVAGCSDTSVWEPISIGCAQFRIDSVRIEGDGAGVFHLDVKQKTPRTIDYNGSDSVHVIFNPFGQAGTFRAHVHLFGTLLGSGGPYDTIIDLLAVSTSTGNPLPAIRYSPFTEVQSCTDGDAYAFLQMGCAQFRIDSVKIEQDTASVFAVDPTQKFPQLLTSNKSDSVHVVFDPNHRTGGFGARLHLYGTDVGSGTSFDTVLTLLAASITPTPVFYSFPQQLQWSSVVECSSGDTTITFQNQGCDTVSADSLHLIAGVTLTSLGLTLPAKVAPNHTISLRVHFTPDGLNSDSLHALLFYSSPGYVDSVAVEITATARPSAPVLVSTVSKVNFGPMLSCDTADTVVYLKNSGCDSLTISSLSNFHGGFSNNPPLTLPITLAKGDSIALHFSYHATSPHDTQTVFVSTKNGGQTGSVKINLSGQISTTPLSVSTDYVSLSTVAICGSADTTIEVTNPGCDTMIVTSADLYPTGDMKLVGVTPPIILPPGSDTLLRLHFAAKNAENFTTTLTLNYTVAGIREPQIEISIAAVATNPKDALALSDTALSIASLAICESDSIHAVLYNPGCDTLVVSANDLTGDPDFVLLSGLDSVKILPGDSVTINLAVLPQAKGNRNAVLHLRYWNSLGSSAHDSTIDLSATITSGVAKVASSLATANLGTISECSSADTSITLRNTGCDTLTIDAGTLDNANFTLQPSMVFPIHIPPDSAFTWRVMTNLDTTGHPTSATSTLLFTSKDVLIPPAAISYSIGYAQASNLVLIPMTDSARADSNVYYDIRDQTTLSKFGTTDVRFALHTSRDVLGYQSASSPNTISEDSSDANGIANYDFDITGSPIAQLPDGTLARLWFKAYVAQETQTPIWIDSTRLDPMDSTFERCTAFLLPPADTTFDIINGCGDQALREALTGQPFTMRVQERNGMTILLIHSPEATAAHLRISNLLGATVSEQDLNLAEGETDVPIASDLPSGAFFLQLSDASGPVARTSIIHLRNP